MTVVPGSRGRLRASARAASAVACLLMVACPAFAADPTVESSSQPSAEPKAGPNPEPGVPSATETPNATPAAPSATPSAEPAAVPPLADTPQPDAQKANVQTPDAQKSDAQKSDTATSDTPQPNTPKSDAAAGAIDGAGRIAGLSGTVSVHASGQSQWVAAVAERALATGEGLWTQPGGSARLALGGAAIELREKTQLELASLSATDAELRLVQGALDLRVPGLAGGATYQIDTPRGAVRVMLAGRYVIEAGGGDVPTKVTVLEGAAQVAGSESGLVVASGQTGLITGVDGGLSFAIEPADVPTASTSAADPAAAQIAGPAGASAPATASETPPATAPETPSVGKPLELLPPPQGD